MMVIPQTEIRTNVETAAGKSSPRTPWKIVRTTSLSSDLETPLLTWFSIRNTDRFAMVATPSAASMLIAIATSISNCATVTEMNAFPASLIYSEVSMRLSNRTVRATNSNGQWGVWHTTSRTRVRPSLSIISTPIGRLAVLAPTRERAVIVAMAIVKRLDFIVYDVMLLRKRCFNVWIYISV